MQVTVITSTVGRPELRQTIESVRAQTYPGVRHMVFVNGPEFHDKAREILKDFPDVHAFYLPESTGQYIAGRGSMIDVFIAGPFLTNADWIFYLDDDNWYEPNHVESIMAMVKEHSLEWAYSLRKIVDAKGNYLADDDWCSLGHCVAVPEAQGVLNCIDNSCFAVSRRSAMRFGLAWTAHPIMSDRCYMFALMESGKINGFTGKSGCTGLSTVNYRINTPGGSTMENDPEAVKVTAKLYREMYPDGFPWRKPKVYDQAIQPLPPP